MDAWASSGVTGILYAEDFNEPPPQEPVAASAWQVEPPGLTQADLDAACIRAVRAAEHAWSDGAVERRTLALEALSSQLAAARAEAAADTEALADGLARSLLGMLAAMLPELCRSHGDAEVRSLLQRLLPVVGREPAVVVRVHAGLLEAVAADLAGLDEDLAGTVQLRAANLPPGDVRISWAEGGLVRDTTAIQAAVEDCLSQLGLLPPSLTETRSLAHAH